MTPPATRRRGEELEAAIFEATLDELGTNGPARLTMESVAKNAKTGKAALYRRWSSLDALIADALVYTLPDPTAAVLVDDLRTDLWTLLGIYREIIDSHNNAAFQVIKDDSQLRLNLCKTVIKTRVAEPLRALLLEVLRRGVERGEVRPEAATPENAQLGPALIMYRCTTDGGDITDDFLNSIIGNTILPAVLAS